MNGTETLELNGGEINPLTPIALHLGYQFISYFPDVAIDAMIAFESIINDNLDYIRSSNGGTLRKIGPNWVNGIGDLMPGEGYLVKMNNPDILIYPVTDEKSTDTKKIKPEYFNFEGGNAAEPVYTMYIAGLKNW